jgi:hypothetical protein
MREKVKEKRRKGGKRRKEKRREEKESRVGARKWKKEMEKEKNARDELERETEIGNKDGRLKIVEITA